MILNRLRSGERQNAADELARALGTRSDLDPHTRLQIQHIISSRRHAGKHPHQSVIDDIAREVRSVNTALGGQGPRGGTMNAMSREQIQQERAELAQRATTASPAERREILRRDNVLNTMLANAPARAATGEVEVNLYEARQTVEDLDEWYSKLGRKRTDEQTQDYNALKDRMGVLIGEAEKRFRINHVDAANTVLAQARLEREQVERELQGAVETRYKNISGADVRKQGSLWRKLTRGTVRTAGSATGLISGLGLAKGLTAAGLASVPVVGGILASAPVVPAVATVIGMGMAGAVAARYAGYLLPWTPLSRKSTRAAEAGKRVRNMVSRESTFTELEQALREGVVHENERVEEMKKLLSAEYGGIFKKTGRGLARTLSYTAAGAPVAGGVGLGMAYAAPGASLLAPKALVGGAMTNLATLGTTLNSYVAAPFLWLFAKAGSLMPVKP